MIQEFDSDSQAEFSFAPSDKRGFFSKRFFLKKKKPNDSSLILESTLNPAVLFKSKACSKPMIKGNNNQPFEDVFYDERKEQHRRDSVETFLKNECKWFHPMNSSDPKRNPAINNRLTSRLIRSLTSKFNLIPANLATKRFRRFISDELYRLFPNLTIPQYKFMDKFSRSLRNKRLESRQ